MLSEQNLRAFLALIAYAEGTDSEAEPYRVCYGYKHTIRSLADHPAVTGEWRGERLPDRMCRGAGLKPGCVSTAAGRYQILKPGWLDGKRALGLPDFSPASQDRWAVWKIGKRGALEAARDGRIAEAINLCRAEWASLPGAGYGQPERKLAALIGTYTDAGGHLA
jgi:muramidase (phage lysozyme)